MESKGGEVRRLHVIYFLSRMGRIEHPHLIRVHHLSRNGVYLRDVKRWLTELRGKDMPESFAWSYKRRYKTGHVWQDLADDDLITPISDNEYVLKGSEISSPPFDPCPYGEKNASVQKHQPLVVKDENHQPSTEEEIQGHPDSKMHGKTKMSTEINEESPPSGSEASTLTDESTKLGEKKHSNMSAQKLQRDDNFVNSSSCYSNLLNKQSKTKKNNLDKTGTPASSFSSSSSPFARSKSHSSGPSHIFRNLITCGAVDTNDSVMVMINRPDKSTPKKSVQKPESNSEISKGERFGGSARIFGTSWNYQQQQQQQQQQHSARRSCDGVKDSKMKFPEQKGVSTAFKPVVVPSCSQCGKSFKPQKMHAHMKSCKGMKALSKGTASAAIEKASSQRTVGSCSKEQISGYLLTQ